MHIVRQIKYYPSEHSSSTGKNRFLCKNERQKKAVTAGCNGLKSGTTVVVTPSNDKGIRLRAKQQRTNWQIDKSNHIQFVWLYTSINNMLAICGKSFLLTSIKAVLNPSLPPFFKGRSLTSYLFRWRSLTPPFGKEGLGEIKTSSAHPLQRFWNRWRCRS